MDYPKEWDLNLNSDTFNGFKSDYNGILRNTLTNMEQKNSRCAEITVKMKITLSEEQVPDLSITAYEAMRNIVVPKFEHKISSVLQIKDEVSGTLSGRYELVWDGERGTYVMREITDNQINMFETGYEVTSKSSDVIDIDPTPDNDEDGALELPGGQPLMLPENTEGDDTEKMRQACREGFPECKCSSCKKFDLTCCSTHVRDCRDTTDCIDYEKTDDCENDEPKGDTDEQNQN